MIVRIVVLALFIQSSAYAFLPSQNCILPRASRFAKLCMHEDGHSHSHEDGHSHSHDGGHSHSHETVAAQAIRVSSTGVKLQLNVCGGPKCQGKCLTSITEAASKFGPAVEVARVSCFDACGKGPNVGISRGDGTGISLDGMTEPERLRRTFMGVKDDAAVARVVATVDAWLAAEPAREAAARAAFNDDPNLTLEVPGAADGDLCLLIKRLSGRDVSAAGYTRAKLVTLLATRCGPLGKEYAATAGAGAAAPAARA